MSLGSSLGHSTEAQIDECRGLLGALCRQDVPLAPLTTSKVGGAARLFVELESLDQIDLVASAVANSGVDVLILGNGSNLLVLDGGFSGLAVKLGPSFSQWKLSLKPTQDRSGVVEVGAASMLPAFSRQLAGAGLSGLEWMVGIPGTVGGAVRMNAGGHGSDVATHLVAASIVDFSDGKFWDMRVDDLDLGYRRSGISARQAVLSASFRVSLGDESVTLSRISEIVRWRRENQPGGPNAGSVFKNPEGDSAGRLIEVAGLKGFRFGSARVSEKHANFIVVEPGGAANDVVGLVNLVIDVVKEKLGVSLSTEVVCVGIEAKSH